MALTNDSGALPNEPTFVQLLQVSRRVNHIIIHDPRAEVEADYGQFLTDVLRTREDLRQSLPETLLDGNGMLRDENPFIFLLSEGNYSFIVGAFSILSIGGAFVPLSWTIQEHVTSRGLQAKVTEIRVKSLPRIDLSASSLRVEKGIVIPSHRPSMLLFTSGTSGPPKGVAHNRGLFYDIHTTSSPSKVFLSHRHHLWIGGVMPLIRHPLAGARLEVIQPDPCVLWERLRKGGVTILAGTPRLWNQYHLQNLPSAERHPYVSGVRSLRSAQVGGGMPHPSLLRFWREDIGRSLRVSYGATELGGRGLKTAPGADVIIEVSSKKLFPVTSSISRFWADNAALYWETTARSHRSALTRRPWRDSG
ncbi:hypothetical protein GB937_010456 [Aspergillus fischeri]|nr:hypothetical protein GB937_010456 [Aspergillus fischeri]